MPNTEHTCRILHRDPTATSCSWRGEVFQQNPAGYFVVPLAAVAELQTHGFYVAPQQEG